MRVAVVIPTLNEAARLPALIDRLLDDNAPPHQRPAPLIVADCDSTDATPALATRPGVHLITNAGLTSRAAALQAGLDLALQLQPDAVWFLHADCLPPPEWHHHITAALLDPRNVGGAFHQRFNARDLHPWQRARLRFVSFANRTRYRLTGSYFGDQGIFATTPALHAIAGIPQLALLEDVELCRRLRQHGRLALCPARMSTSPRRFTHHGILKQFWADTLILALAVVGLRCQPLHHWYNQNPGN